ERPTANDTDSDIQHVGKRVKHMGVKGTITAPPIGSYKAPPGGVYVQLDKGKGVPREPVPSFLDSLEFIEGSVR
ncbi:hypothetical protein, partial [Bacillus cereus]|uniref:hypothetical protein n=1 Tax=Bacillus cereus TaxID=1396 RepID=UPI0034D4AFE8